MRRPFWQMMVTLDGLVEGPSSELDWHVAGKDLQRYLEEMLRSIDAILLGRVTYAMVASGWPSAANPETAG